MTDTQPTPPTLLCETHRSQGVEAPTDFLKRGPDDANPEHDAKGVCVRCILTEQPYFLMEPLYTEAEVHPLGMVNFRVAASIIVGERNTLSELEARYREIGAEYRSAILAELATKLVAAHPDATRSSSVLGDTITTLLDGNGRRLKLLGIFVGNDRTLAPDSDPVIADLVDQIVTVDPVWAYDGVNEFQMVIPKEEGTADA